jgi:hypothetical protein
LFSFIRQAEVYLLTPSIIFIFFDIKFKPRKLWQSYGVMPVVLVVEVCFVGCASSVGAAPKVYNS